MDVHIHLYGTVQTAYVSRLHRQMDLHFQMAVILQHLAHHLILLHLVIIMVSQSVHMELEQSYIERQKMCSHKSHKPLYRNLLICHSRLKIWKHQKCKKISII